MFGFPTMQNFFIYSIATVHTQYIPPTPLVFIAGGSHISLSAVDLASSRSRKQDIWRDVKDDANKEAFANPQTESAEHGRLISMHIANIWRFKGATRRFFHYLST